MLGYFPIAWKSTKVIPIPKPWKPPFHPVGLLHTLSKLLEQVEAHRLNSFIHQNQILPPEQFSFHQQHSTVSQLARITNFPIQWVLGFLPGGVYEAGNIDLYNFQQANLTRKP